MSAASKRRVALERLELPPGQFGEPIAVFRLVDLESGRELGRESTKRKAERLATWLGLKIAVRR